MNTMIMLVAGTLCAPGMDFDSRIGLLAEEGVPSPKVSPSRITAVTVYRGQAMVTREVKVEGQGTVELVVSPLPAEVLSTSLSAEGNENVRVLSTRFRRRALASDSRADVRAIEEQIKKLVGEAGRLEKRAQANESDQQYVKKLEGFTGVMLNGLTEKGRLDSDGVRSLSTFLMETRATKSGAEIELRDRIRENSEALDLAKRKLQELSAGPTRVENDAVIVVQKPKSGADAVRLGYLVGQADWTPQYRLKSTADNAPVRLEYLASVVQQSGEPWEGVSVTLSTARPSIDAAPPDLSPLRMRIPSAAPEDVPLPGGEAANKVIREALEMKVAMNFANETPLEDVLKYVKSSTQSQALPNGIPIYLDPIGLTEAEKTPTSSIRIDLENVPLKVSLKLLLKQLGLEYKVEEGLLKITAADEAVLVRSPRGDSGELPGEPMDQAKAEDDGVPVGGLVNERETPGVSFAVAGKLDIPSRRDPQWLEIARSELPAEFSAKAVPVLTSRVYRLAKLTNATNLVLLPGEATVHAGGDFVGRMRLPLVAAGEAFVAGFGVDPQVQVTRRLIRKERTIQGGNQIFTYEFRIGLRNYRQAPVKVQVWDRLPKPKDESVIVGLLKTSVELSNDLLYQRTGRLDNLLRWDLTVPAGTVGDKAQYQTYEFKVEYARDLPAPRFEAGDLREMPIGGGAMGGMGGMGGGMGGGFRSVGPRP